MQTKVSVIILNWNGEKLLKKFLPSVIRHTPPKYEIVVADNASTDRSIEVLRDEFPSVRIVRFAENYGFAEGYNRAIYYEDCDYVVLLNSDVEVSDNWLEPLVKYLDNNVQCAAVQPKLRAYNNPQYFEYAGAVGGFIDQYGYPFCRGRILEKIEQDNGQYEEVSNVLWASGAALCIRKTAYEAVGGLDNGFFAHMEEIDLCWRLRCRGWTIACVPKAIVYHVGGASLNKMSAQKTFLNFRNNLLMLYKNLPELQLKRTLQIRKYLDYLAALKFALCGDLAHAKAVLKARKAFYTLLPQYEEMRRNNLALTTVDHIPEILPHSLLYLYYLKGKKTFKTLSIYFTI